jgi:hypothetical protein
MYTIIFALLPYSLSWATVINVPGDYPTIQQGINAAGYGDTVLVAPGTYYENVQMAEGVSLIGSGMEYTTIDGGGLNDVIKALNIYNFRIERFTVQNSRQDGNSPGNMGIFMNPSSSSGTKYVRYCRVRNNGHGVEIWNDFGGTAYVENNIIEDNIYDGFDPYLGTVYLTNNIIRGNGRDGYHDWAGGGVVYIKNNIFAENGRYGIFKHRDTPVFISYNDVWNNAQGAYYEGYSGPATPFNPNPGTGEIASDPLFRDPDTGDFRLSEDSCGYLVDSPCIDAGDPGILDNLHGCDWGLEYPVSDMGIYGGNNGDFQTGVEYDDITLLPESIFNLQNYPNPFNAATTISFTLPYESHISLTVYDILGRRVETLVDRVLPAGSNCIRWDASGNKSGTYLYVIKMGSSAEANKLVLLK